MRVALIILIAGMMMPIAQGQVIINEIYYHPASGHELDEFVELYNPGSGPIEVDQWSLTGDVEFVIPESTVIPAGGFLVIARDTAQFTNTFGAIPGSLLGGWDVPLDNGGGLIALVDDAGQPIDSVSYLDERPWPLSADGDGASLELISPNLDNSSASAWRPSLSSGPTPGRQNSVFASNPPPFISEVKWIPEKPGSSDRVDVTARIEDANGISSVQLFYQVKTSSTSILMYDDGAHNDGSASDGVFGAAIPPQASQTIVKFYVVATDGSSAQDRSPYFGETVDRYAYFVYDGEVAADVPVYWMEINSADLSYLDAHSDSEETRSAYLVDADGNVYPKIQVRHRGAGAPYWLKKSWKFFFNHGQDFQGQRAINLNSQWAYDPTRLREHVAYQVMELFDVPASKTQMVQLRINNTYWGLFTEIENPNRDYLRRNGHSDQGDLYKARSTSVPANQTVLSSLAQYQEAYSKETNEWESYDALIEWIEALNSGAGNDSTVLFERLDIRKFTRYFSAVICVSTWDAIFKNYYLYNKNPEGGGRWEIFPWDVDRTWGEFHPGIPPWNSDERVVYWIFQPLTWGQTGLPWPLGPNGLWNRYLRSDATRRYLHRQLRQDCHTRFVEKLIYPLWENAYTQCWKEVEKDYNKYHVSEPENNYGLRWEVDRHKRYVTERREFILGQLLPPEPVINEILADNLSGATDEGGIPMPWLEIFNPSPVAWDLTGHYLSDDIDDPTRWPFPANTQIPPDGHLLIWCDGEPGAGPLHSSFALSVNGGGVGLFDTDANGNLPLDWFDYSAQAADLSCGRAGDGAWVWRFFESPTPGSSNGRRPDPVQLDLSGHFTHDVIVSAGDLGTANNDFLSGNTSLIESGVDGARGMPSDRRIGQYLLADYQGPNAIALHGRSDPIEIDIDNQPYEAIRFLHAVGGGDATIQMECVYIDGSTDSTILNLEYWGADFNKQGVHEENLVPLNWMDRSNTSLTGRGERITRAIFSQRVAVDEGKSLDTVRFLTSTYTPQSNPGWVFALLADPPQPEYSVDPIENVFINEWMADNETTVQDEGGDFEDWLELYNANDQPVNLGGAYLTDNLEQPLKWKIPSNTIISAKGFLLIWCDSDVSDGPLHAGFKLDKEGESIGLSDSAGALIDSVTFELMGNDQAIGRLPDGKDGIRSLGIPTPGWSNQANLQVQGWGIY